MNDPYRPAFHFTPPSMWLNDPNGLVYYAGEYHLFYQYHPHSTVWGPMHWGHAVSTDLIHWQHLPIALYPDEHGMIFSGSAVIDWNNTAGFGKEAMVAIFTYNINYKETQNLAYSTDRGRTWTKYAGNPVVPAPEPLSDCRDPKVFWHADHWVMALAAKDRILFFISNDLKHWVKSGSFGGGYGSTDGVWETPDLFQLPVSGSDSRWVLTVGVGSGAYAGGSGTQYFIGDFDGKTFMSENPKETTLWMDHGADFYAPQSWNDEPNGRRISIAWMSNWQYAREIPTTNWRGMFSVPREVSLRTTPQGPRLFQQPIPELANLHDEVFYWSDKIIHPQTNLLADLNGSCLEINAEFRIIKESDQFGLRVGVGEGCRTTITYSVKDQRLSVGRAFSGVTQFHPAFASIHAVPLTSDDNLLRLQILLDRSALEVFANQGQVTFAELIFPLDGHTGLEVFAVGGTVVLTALKIFRLNPAQFHSTEQ